MWVPLFTWWSSSGVYQAVLGSPWRSLGGSLVDPCESNWGSLGVPGVLRGSQGLLGEGPGRTENVEGILGVSGGGPGDSWGEVGRLVWSSCFSCAPVGGVCLKKCGHKNQVAWMQAAGGGEAQFSHPSSGSRLHAHTNQPPVPVARPHAHKSVTTVKIPVKKVHNPNVTGRKRTSINTL